MQLYSFNLQIGNWRYIAKYARSSSSLIINVVTTLLFNYIHSYWESDTKLWRGKSQIDCNRPDVSDHANRPHVQRSIVTLALQYFWGCKGLKQRKAETSELIHTIIKKSSRVKDKTIAFSQVTGICSASNISRNATKQ